MQQITYKANRSGVMACSNLYTSKRLQLLKIALFAFGLITAKYCDNFNYQFRQQLNEC